VKQSTDGNGQVQVITVTHTSTSTPIGSATNSSPSASTTGDPPPTSGGSKTGKIVGLSVCGGLAVLGIVGFIVWKFTRKRFNDDDFDSREKIRT
jgi:hypothetical protein